MGRPRKFPHEEAAALRRRGWTLPRIAALYGVSENAVGVAVMEVEEPEEYARRMERRREWTRLKKRKPCKGGCGRLVWTHGTKRTGYCARCLAVEQHGADVRPGELRCTRCREWKPDEEFYPYAEGQTRHLRRGRKPHCRTCESATRKERRHRRRVPCANCGRPRSHPDDVKRADRRRDTGLCAQCAVLAVGVSNLRNLRRAVKKPKRRRLRARPLSEIRRRA